MHHKEDITFWWPSILMQEATELLLMDSGPDFAFALTAIPGGLVNIIRQEVMPA